MSVEMRRWASLLCLGFLARQVTGICEEQRYLRTDGYTFKFTVDVMFHLENADANDRLTILSSSTGAFQLYRQSDTKVVFTVVKQTDSSEVAVASTEVTSLMTWYTLTVEKTIEEACITVDNNVKNCAVAQHTDVGDAGEVTALNQQGVEVRHYLQAPVEHAQKFKYEASSGKLFQYFLVAIQDSAGRTFRDDYADASSEALGKYVKPKFGSFSRLLFDCGYELGGVLGSIEIEGGWSWGPTPDAYHRALLQTTVGSPTLVEKTNVGFEPTLPPYLGDGRFQTPWNNGNSQTSFLATFGSGGYLYLNGGFQNENGVFACDPSSTVSPSDSLTWAPSPSGSGDTNRYVRVWLGQEVGTSPDTTATTTGTCTTTTTTTTSTSSTSSGTSTVPPTTTTSSYTATGTTATTIEATTTTTSTATSTETTSTGSSSTTSTRSDTTTTTTTMTTTTMTTTTMTTTTTATTSTSATGTTSTTRSTTSTSSSRTTTSSSTSTESSTFSSTSTSSSSSSTNTITTSSTSTRTSTFSSTTTSSTSSSSTRTSTTSVTSTSTTSSTGSSTVSTTTSTSSSSTRSSTTSVTSTSTTSSTGSSTVSTTTSSTWSSTTTTSTTSTTMDLSALFAWVSSQESALVDSFLRGPNASSMSTKLPGLTLAVFWTNRHTDSTLDVEGSQASLMVPGSVLDTLGLERAVVLVSVFDSEAEFPALLSLAPLLATVNVNFFDPAGRRLQVKDVPEPFRITMPMPANRSRLEASCAYWDVEGQQWSQRGMQEVLTLQTAEGEDDGLLLCSATHLTLFGALLKGFFKAITCAQVSLLSMKAVKQVFIGGWWSQPMALMFWLLEVIFVIILAAACLVDYSRQRKGTWDNEFFLIPLQARASAACTPNCPEVEEEQEEEPHPGWKKSISRVLQQPVNWFCQSSGCRQALDDICSRWFKYFGEVRGFIETICEKIQCSRGCGMKTICASLAGSLLCDSVQRQVSASLGLSEDVVSCFLEDEDLAELISEAAVISEKLKAAGPSSRWEERLLAWHTTHQKILEKFDEHWKGTGWSSFPMAFVRLFYVGNPVASLFLNCQYMTCSLRVLFFAVEIFGALLMLTLFHQVGGTMAEDADPECLEDAADIWEELGSIMAIALGTILVANVPVMVLESLHTRSFRKFDYVGCPEWKRQLTAWKIQDVLIWIIGLGYIGFCGLFVVLFLANVAEPELLEWGVTEGISLAEDCVIIPVAISLVVPSLAGFSLALASLTARAHPSEILKKQKAELEDASGNRKPFILTI